MKIYQLWKNGEEYLKNKGIADYKADARFLLCHLTGYAPSNLLLHSDEDADEQAYRELLEKRASGIPLQYVVGETEFMSLPFKVNENVLIPRQETEIIVEMALEEAKKINCPTVWDFCTGSGCIAVSFAKYCKNCKVFALDISEKALDVAKENAKLNGVDVCFVKDDVLRLENKVKDADIIISNPPYIQTEIIKTLQPEVRTKEPMGALDGGEDGLTFYRAITPVAYEGLKTGGVLIYEIGWDQGEDVSEILRKNGFGDVEVRKDYSGLDRIVAGRK